MANKCHKAEEMVDRLMQLIDMNGIEKNYGLHYYDNASLSAKIGRCDGFQEKEQCGYVVWALAKQLRSTIQLIFSFSDLLECLVAYASCTCACYKQEFVQCFVPTYRKE